MLSDRQNILLAKHACLCSCERSDSHYRTYVALASYATVFTICTTGYNFQLWHPRCVLITVYKEWYHVVKHNCIYLAI